MKNHIEDSDTNLESYLGKEIVIYCCRYIYAGTLVSIDNFCLRLKDCGIVYDTGSAEVDGWETFEKFKNDKCVALQSIESFGEIK